MGSAEKINKIINMWEIVDGHKYGNCGNINPDDYIYLEKHIGGITFYKRLDKLDKTK